MMLMTTTAMVSSGN